jgi:glucosamine-6-phosphate deaminase
VDVVVVDPAELDARGTDLVAGWLGPRPGGALLAALGTSALGVYRGLAARRDAGTLDTSRLTVVQLDEYAELADGDPRSLRGWLDRDVAAPLDVPADRVIGLPSPASADEAVVACAAYDDAIDAAGGIDVAVLGLGPNGHLGFNEPPSNTDEPTRLVELSAASLESNRRYWAADNAVPRLALTAGMTVLLGARRTLLIVSGGTKAPILRRLVADDVSPELPASLLRTIAGVTLLADTAAWPADLAIPAMISG